MAMSTLDLTSSVATQQYMKQSLGHRAFPSKRDLAFLSARVIFSLILYFLSSRAVLFTLIVL